MLINQDVETINLIAMLVVDDHRLHRLERNVNDVANAVEALLGRLATPSHLKVEFQVFDRPLAAVLLVVIFGALLDCNVGQMDHHVVELGDIRGVLLRAETGKTARVPNKGEQNRSKYYPECSAILYELTSRP